jgi:hypothetical protein
MKTNKKNSNIVVLDSEWMQINLGTYYIYFTVGKICSTIDVFVNFVEAARQFVFNIQYRSRGKVLICAKHVYLEERQKN